MLVDTEDRGANGNDVLQDVGKEMSSKREQSYSHLKVRVYTHKLSITTTIQHTLQVSTEQTERNLPY